MRILLGMPDPDSLGGPAACEPPFADELRRLGLDVVEETYVYGEGKQPLSTLDRVRRVATTAKRLTTAIAASAPDVIHLNTSFDSRALLRDAFVMHRLKGSQGKVFLKLHGSDLDLLQNPPGRFRPLISYILSRAHGIGLLSSEERNAFAATGVDPAKLFVVRNVVEPLPTPTAAPQLLRQRIGIPADVPVLLFISRFIPTKGLIDIIDAVAILRDQGRRVHLACVGDGRQRASAEARVREMSLTEQVHFTGYIPEAEAAEFYAGSTMLVFPTYHFEGFPMVIFKSLAAGIPIITTQIRAAADYLSEPQNCLWTPPRDPVALAERVVRLLDDHALGQEMSNNNRQLSSNFTAASVTSEYVEIYRALLGS